MKKLLHTIEKYLGIYRWHPKIALRYLPIVAEIKKLELSNISILEAGSAGLGIVPYIRQRVVGVDLTFPPPIAEQLIPVKASATDIPFINNSFDVALSTDMLEHIPPKDRQLAIFEMLRVAKKLVIIGVPTGKLSEQQDEELKNLYEHSRSKQFGFLSEQVEYGLPSIEFIEECIEKSAFKLKKNIRIKKLGNINLDVRKILMHGWISNSFWVNIIFRKFMLLFIPLLRNLNQPPTYRTIFIVTIEANENIR